MRLEVVMGDPCEKEFGGLADLDPHTVLDTPLQLVVASLWFLKGNREPGAVLDNGQPKGRQETSA